MFLLVPGITIKLT